jgi:HK97 family phage major capsid protein
MSEFIKRSEETRANLVMQMRDVIDSAEQAKRGLDSEEMKKLDNLEAEYQRHAEAIEVARRNEERALEASAAAGLFVPQEESRNAGDIFRAMGRGEVRGHNFGFESRATLVPSANTVPVEFLDRVFLRARLVGPYLEVSDVIQRSSGSDLRIPVLTAYSTAAEVAAGSAIADSEPTFSSLLIQPTKQAFLSSVANELLSDNGFDVESTIAEQAGNAIGTRANTVIHAAVVAAAGTGVTAGTTNAITADELISLAFSVDGAVRRIGSAAYMVSTSTAGAIRRLKDNNGSYIFEPITGGNGINGAVNATGTILGFPVYENNAVANIATTTKPVFFGAWDQVKVATTGLDVATSVDYAFNQDVTTYRFSYRLGAAVANGVDHVKCIVMA